MNTLFNPDVCPIKLKHICTDDGVGTRYVTAFHNRYSGEVALLILQMLKHQGDGVTPAGSFREFTQAELTEYARSSGQARPEKAFSVRGLENLTVDGYVIHGASSGGEGYYEVSLEFVGICFGHSAELDAIYESVEA